MGTLFKSFDGINFYAGLSPLSNYDYYEPRVPGRYYRTSQYYLVYGSFSSDYRRPIAIDISANASAYLRNNIHHFPLKNNYNLYLAPRFRVNDHLSFIYQFSYGFDPNNVGFANFDNTQNIIFGSRILHTYENILTATYVFINNLSLSINVRHYWRRGEYKKHYTLLQDGMLEDNVGYTGNDNFNYNVFNIDAVFSWEFAPGSTILLAYKNAIEKDERIIIPAYEDNFNKMMQLPQSNSISIKALYYLDYQNIKRKRQERKHS